MDIVIIGAGVAGLSTAYHLARDSKSKILVLEQEKTLGGHASGRNAGMIRQTVPDPAIARLAHEGRRCLEEASRGRSGWKKFNFLSNGSLLLAKKNKAGKIETIKLVTAKEGVFTEWLSPKEAAAKVPLLRDGDFDRALFCPSDAILETKPLLRSFQAQLKKQGVPILFNTFPLKIKKEEGYFLIDLGKKIIRTKKIVNAAGAWCALLAEKMGAQKIPLQPYRRHLYLTRPVVMGQGRWPFVWDLSHDFYFRPEGKGLLFSPCDKERVGKKFLTTRLEPVNKKIQAHLTQKLKNYSQTMGKLVIQAQKSGLRTMVPDGKFVIGEDAKLPFFYWVAGLGGHGVTTCFSVGKLSSDIILGGKVDSVLANAFSPRRFEKGLSP